MFVRRAAASCGLILALVGVGCEYRTGTSQQPQYPATGQYPQGQYPQTQPQPASQPTVAGQTSQQPAPQTQPGATTYSPALDPINNVDALWLRNRAQAIYQELVAALPAGPQARIAGIPLVLDQDPTDVNAFATCTQNNKAFIEVTDGLMDVMAHLAQCKATDEIFGTRKTDEYIQYVAKNQKSGAPPARPPVGFFNAQQHLDARKVARQHQVFDEEVAFVVGHEMGHHYLGHLPCTAQVVTAAEVGMVLSSAVPAFNQPNEVAADMGGTKDVLAAGARRTDYHYTEGGGLLTMQFFAGLDQFSPIDILFGFERSHPAAQIRTPVIQQTAATWRATGGALPPVF
jgi:hypothetical protein